MIKIFETQSVILSSQCDSTASLSVGGTLNIFQDIATQHASIMGASVNDLFEQSNAFWVAVRTKVHAFDFPKIQDKVSLITWPTKPTGTRCERYYILKRDGITLLEGKTQWAVIDVDTKKARYLDSTCYPVDMECNSIKACNIRYFKFIDSFEKKDFIDKVIIKSTDIDFAQHTNNVIYSRFVLDTFSNEYLRQYKISEFDISYCDESHEGEVIYIYKKRYNNSWLFSLKKKDDAIVAYACVKF